MIEIKRVYDRPEANEGSYFLVDRLWPRGLRKERVRLDGWLKEVAPSDPLRRWFGHDPSRWEEFKRRYSAELDKNPQACEPILELARRGDVTLLYAARDSEHNNAAALRDYLMARLKRG